MTKFYYYEDNSDPMTSPHNSGKEVDPSKLQSLGVFYEKMPLLAQVNALAIERRYQNRDEIKLNSETVDLSSKLDIFFKEHLHDDEEIRYITSGSGYFDVRDLNDDWIRLEVSKGDMLILPAGIFHRFTLTENLNVEAIRLFKEEPKWVAIPRTTSNMNNSSNSRIEYLSSL